MLYVALAYERASFYNRWQGNRTYSEGGRHGFVEIERQVPAGGTIVG